MAHLIITESGGPGVNTNICLRPEVRLRSGCECLSYNEVCLVYNHDSRQFSNDCSDCGRCHILFCTQSCPTTNLEYTRDVGFIKENYGSGYFGEKNYLAVFYHIVSQ